jgi:hypothetical protein
MYDIIFISNNEIPAENHWRRLKSRFVTAYRIDGIKGIHAAHKLAANRALTKMFWVVDGDSYILDSFNFSYKVHDYDQDIVHIFKSINPINGLKYGYGAVKLLPKRLTQQLDESSLDMTMNISKKIKVINEVSNVTVFNTDQLSTWRSAFREAAKLTINVELDIDKNDSSIRLYDWMHKGQDMPFGKECISGARSGNEYARAYYQDIKKISKINDFDWLKEQFIHAGFKCI